MSCGSNADCADGVIETALKLSAIPVIVSAAKYNIIDVDGVVNAIISIGIATNTVPTTIAFHAFAVFFPTQTPAIVGSIIVRIVLGICNAPVRLADAFITCNAPTGA